MPINFRLCATLLVTALISACGGGGGGGDDGEGNQSSTVIVSGIGQNDYLPADTQARWGYEDAGPATSNGGAVRYVDAIRVRGRDVNALRWADTVTEYYLTDSKTVRLAGLKISGITIPGQGTFSADLIFDSFVKILDVEEDQVPTRINLNLQGTANVQPTYGNRNFSITGSVTYQGREMIDVPYGTFDAIKIAYNLDFDAFINGAPISLRYSNTTWFAESVGIVRRQSGGTNWVLESLMAGDRDGDGVADFVDDYPDNPDEFFDLDDDGIPPDVDDDDDGDGFADGEDAFPLDDSEWLDTDGDFVGNNTDTNDDNDPEPDVSDAFPLDPAEWVDTDSDGVGNNADTDDDGDGVADVDDDLPLDPNDSVDTDGDGFGNSVDDDDDGDGFDDNADMFPLDETEWLDTDGDGTGNNADTDDDNDTYLDVDDDLPLDPTEWLDTDADGVGNNADADDDGDGLADVDDPEPENSGVPGIIFSIGPGLVMADTAQRIAIGGRSLSAFDTFYLNDVEVSVSFEGPDIAYLDIPALSTGQYSVSANNGEIYASDATFTVIAAAYYPYAEIDIPDGFGKFHFNPLTQTITVRRDALRNFTYLDSGWAETATFEYPGNSGQFLYKFAVSPDYKVCYAGVGRDIYELDCDTLALANTYNTEYGAWNDMVIDTTNRVLLAAPVQQSLLILDGHRQSSTFGSLSVADQEFDAWQLGRSADGSRVLLADAGDSGSRIQKYYLSKTGYTSTETFGDGLTIIHEANDIDFSPSTPTLDGNGESMIVDDTLFYDDDANLLATLGLNSIGSVVGVTQNREGTVAFLTELSEEIHMFDLNSADGGGLAPIHTVVSPVDYQVYGSPRDMVLSPDGLTLFVATNTKMLVIPVWQIEEDRVGSSDTCPTGGCGAIPVAVGF